MDEQLVGFRGNCRFRIYIPSKPSKYGIKIIMADDATTACMFNALPYTGETTKEKELKEKKKAEKVKAAKKAKERKKAAPDEPDAQGEQKTELLSSKYVKKLTEPIHNTNRCVTYDNWFSSVPLFEEMLTFKILMVGTLRSNKPEVPTYFLEKQDPNSTIFGFDDTKVLVSYSENRNENKNCLLLSTLGLLYNKDINPRSKKLNIVLHYNQTKSGTDTFDQLCGNYTTARKTNRWSMRMMYAILDQAGVNSMILYTLNVRRLDSQKTPSASSSRAEQPSDRLFPRRKFLQNLAKDLVKPLLLERLQNPSVRITIKNLIKEVLGIDEPVASAENVEDATSEEGAVCHICRRNNVKRKKVGNCATDVAVGYARNIES